MRGIRSKFILLAFTALGASPAVAQTQPEVTDAAAEDIIVTGSRIITSGDNAPTPITVVSPEALAVTRPGRVFESLQDLPVFSGSRGVTGVPSNAQPNSSTAVSALNLRNLGGLRALALFDGKRIPPTTADGYVNVNAVPQMLLQRVDIVTGGASAVYGSDAVSGVVNFITDRKFTGFKGQIQGGVSGHSDAESYDVGLAWGANLGGGRGHVALSYQRVYNAGIGHLNQRSWTAPDWTLQGNGTTVPYHLQDNMRIAFATFGGLIVCPGSVTAGFRPANCPTAPLVGQTFNSNGVLSAYQAGSTAGVTVSDAEIGGGGAYHTWPSLAGKVGLDQIYGRFDYELTDAIHFYVQGSGTYDHVTGNPTNLRFFGRGVNIGACNAFLAASYQAGFGCTSANNDINSTTQPTFTFNKIFNYEMNPAAPGAIMESKSRSYFVMTGLEGELGEKWKWDLGYTHSLSKYRLNVNRNMDLSRTYAALDAVVDPSSGKVVCRVTLTNPGLYPGCVPLNVFGPSAESAEALQYIFTQVWHETTNTLDDVNASVTGSPFALWAGPVEFALSGEYRRQTYSLVTNSPATLTQTCTGLRFGNCTAGVTGVNINQFGERSQVAQKVTEGALEVNVPLLKDAGLLRELNFNGAVRYTHYANDPGASGFTATKFNATTWKLGLTWDVADILTLRAGRSRDIRAPNLYDLYSPVSLNRNSFTQDQLLGGVNVNVPIQSGGNPDLKPEVANTLTIGAVLRPAPGLSFALDFYDIRIKDALATISGSTNLIQNTCIASGGASPLCALLVRASGNPLDKNSALTLVYNRNINIAEQHARGWDFEANWRTGIGGKPFSIRALVTYQPTLVYSQVGLPTQNQAGVTYNATYGLYPTPKWKASVFVHFEPAENFSIDLAERWRSALRLAPEPQLVSGHIPSVAYTNLTLTLKTHLGGGNQDIFFNVQNLFDKDPPPGGQTNQQNQPGLVPNGYNVGDDVIGRYFTAGVRFKF
ncbi:TonB-dependent receptor [Novosphingobium flavum]|uniref:TonB-dependent receptor n=1 Tax=Novosphingobium flavum TaxID=1778672 RepID=A0A7X1FU15_9SPHN|nr:TonB-dependent receptor [Novosphingobium flavum]MBC2666834.1 TonB-dependent receptor [Novosphingobium flavum]